LATRVRGTIAILGRPYANGGAYLEIRVPKPAAEPLQFKVGRRVSVEISIDGITYTCGLRATADNPNVTFSPDLVFADGKPAKLGPVLIAAGFGPRGPADLLISDVPSGSGGKGKPSMRIAVVPVGGSQKGMGTPAIATSTKPASTDTNGSKYAAKYLERWGESDFAEYLAWLCPNQQSLKLLASQLGDSILVAHSLAPRRWGITKNPLGIRFNVGKMEAAMVTGGNFCLMVDGPLLKKVPDRALVDVDKPVDHVAVAGGSDENVHDEGRRRDVIQSVAERNPAARKACIAHYGTTCSICDKKLEEMYGEVAKDLVHVHHLTPFAGDQGTRKTDPIADLRPLCPNCHAIVHRAAPPLSIAHVRELMRGALERKGEPSRRKCSG